MATTVKSKQSFKRAVLSGEEEIKVDEPELAKWLVAVHAIKQLAWTVAIVLVATGIYSALASGGAAAPGALGATALATGVVGVGGATAMVGLGLALGGVAGLKAVRSKYRITEKGQGYVVLKRK
jgi:hypothetical protein